MIDLAKYPKFAQDSRLMKRVAFLEIEWRRSYPNVDFQNQAGWAHAWLCSSGKKYSDMSRFLNNWFKRCAQDLEKAGSVQGPIKMPVKVYKEEKPAEEDVMTADDFSKMRETIRGVRNE